MLPNPAHIRCVVFDFGGTLSSDLYFKVAPPGYPVWRSLIKEHVFDQRAIVDAWMEGQLSLADIAVNIGHYVDWPISDIIAKLEAGCKGLSFNPVVWNFAAMQRQQGRKTALVTANMDVFTKVVVPAHALDKLFDTILNTADYHELRKKKLWPLAFAQLGPDISYANSLLIEDGPSEPARFRALGGYAYQYESDDHFREWLALAGWSNA
jgi:phosphoserine phosphatase